VAAGREILAHLVPKTVQWAHSEHTKPDLYLPMMVLEVLEDLLQVAADGAPTEEMATVVF
jgi:hypothetical protein